MNNRIVPGQSDPQFRETLLAVLQRIASATERMACALERGNRGTDEYRGVFLNSKFPYGDGKTDRWGRRRG